MEQKTRLQWHPAFAAVLRIELEKELGRLEIKDEVQLTKKPLQMDVLLIKKGGEEPVEKNIGRIFRRYNIIEYKSPGDSLSVNDFYKVYGYACIYQSDTDRVMEIRPQELTLTLCAAVSRESCWSIWRRCPACQRRTITGCNICGAICAGAGKLRS